MRILLSFLLLLSCISFSAAQTPRTRAAMTTEINTNFADNNSGAITPALARSTYLDMAASAQFLGEIVPPPGGRLTLQSHTPVMLTTQSAKTTVYYDCYVSNNVSYFNGTIDAVQAIPSCEASTALQNSGTGVLNTTDVFDVWWSGANTNICIATNGSGGGWTGDGGSTTARGAGYTVLDRSTRPYTTNKNAIAHCYNGSTDYGSISANQATYLGTILTTGAGQTGFIYGSAASGGGQSFMYVWNMYNRVDFITTVTDNGVAYTYTSSTIRAARGSAANTINYITGILEDGLVVSYSQQITTTANAAGFGLFGIGNNVANAFYANFFQCFTNANAVQSAAGSIVNMIVPPNVGFAFITAVEASDNTHAQTFASGATLVARLRM